MLPLSQLSSHFHHTLFCLLALACAVFLGVLHDPVISACKLRYEAQQLTLSRAERSPVT